MAERESMQNKTHVWLLAILISTAPGYAGAVGIIESVEVHSGFVDGPFWRGSTWEGVTEDGTTITAFEDSEVRFGSMVMDPWLMDNELVSANGKVQLSLPRNLDTPGSSSFQLAFG